MKNDSKAQGVQGMSECATCGTPIVTGRKVRGPISCGSGACLEQHNAEASDRRSRKGTTRSARREPVIAGEMGMAMLIARITR